MSNRMQYCCWCGEELGIFDSGPEDYETCGAKECEKEAGYMEQSARADRQCEAEQDDYQRY